MKALRIIGSEQDRSTFRWRGGVFVLATLIIIATFVAGFGVAMFFHPRVQSQTVTVPPTDFDLSLLEGATTVTITDPRLDNQQLARFVVERHGNSFTGLPESQKQIAARPRLSLEDATFFRREMAGIVYPSDSRWQRAIRIRNWLATRRYRTALPGLATRAPREAYLELSAKQRDSSRAPWV
jgi:hypothetical protein